MLLYDILILRPAADVDPSFAGFVLSPMPSSRKRFGPKKAPRCLVALGARSETRVFCPEPCQQERIGKILCTVDEAIEETEALIAKMQQIKAGLMRDLFTRGVTADGQLRRTREEAPQLYKESPLGWIPKEWEIHTLRGCLFDNPTNGMYKPADQIGRGTLLVGQTSFTEERSIDFSLARRAVVGAEELRRYALAEGNILLSRVFATLDGVGQPTLVPSLPEPAVYESNMMRLRVDPTRIDPLAIQWLRSHRARRLIVAGANASNQSSINQQVLNPLPILVPPSLEQERLLSIIESDDERASWARWASQATRREDGAHAGPVEWPSSRDSHAAAEPQEVAANV
jgi:type I restriction enzyme S subunit